jgi:ribosomal protein S18 acetylase RimI-like enzyme
MPLPNSARRFDTPARESIISDMSTKIMDKVMVRDARASDAAAIAGLLGELGYPAEAVAVRRRLKRLRRSHGGRALVAAANGCVLGVVGLYTIPLLHRDHSLCRILALCVGADFARRGVGTKLMHAAESVARRAGCHRVELTTAPERATAHKFYRSLGYQQASVRFAKTLE